MFITDKNLRNADTAALRRLWRYTFRRQPTPLVLDLRNRVNYELSFRPPVTR